VKDLPEGARPRERLLRQGPAALGDAELLAILLRTGTRDLDVLALAHILLASYRGLGGLGRATAAELCRQKGVGPTKAVELLAAFELGKRFASLAPEERRVVRQPADVAQFLMPEMASLDREHLRVVLLNTKNQVLDVPEVYRGSLNSAIIRVAEVFREAIRQNCAAVIVVHNHPSGDPTPSAEDIRVTQQLVEAGRLLDIEVLDHLVIGQQRWVSLREHGLGFPRR